MKISILMILTLSMLSCGGSNKSGNKKDFTPGLTNGESTQSESLIGNSWCNTQRFLEDGVLIEELTRYSFERNANVSMTVTENGETSSMFGQWSFDGTYLKLNAEGSTDIYTQKVSINESELIMFDAIENEDQSFEDVVYSTCN